MGASIIVPIKLPEPYYPFLREALCGVFANVEYELLEQYELGLVNAVAHGVRRSKFDLVAVLDADGSHRPIDLYNMYLFALANNYDIVIGSKVLGLDKNPFYRKVLSFIYRLLARLMLNYKLTDPMSGMVVCKKELMLKIKPTSEYKFLLQIMLFTGKFKELPIIFEKRKGGNSKVNPIMSIYTFYNFFKLRRKYAMLKNCANSHFSNHVKPLDRDYSV